MDQMYSFTEMLLELVEWGSLAAQAGMPISPGSLDVIVV